MNLLYDGPGAVLDVAFADAQGNPLVAAWEQAVRHMLAALGRQREVTRVRRFPGGASLFISSPIDTLYAATEINEWAWAEAERRVGGKAGADAAQHEARLRARVAKEHSPALLKLCDAAAAKGLTFASDHKATSVGSGRGSIFWQAPDSHTPAAPDPEKVDWRKASDVPIVLVTGSNGKTTTVRLMASVVKAWKKTPGISSTDNIVIGDEVIDAGDWSGPMGARAVLRDKRVDVAICETARGGILRRGLAVTRADAAIVTNIAEDHFGEWGIFDLKGIAETKLVVGHVVPRLMINAEDPVLVEVLAGEQRRDRIHADIGYFSLDPAHPVIVKHLAQGRTAAFTQGGNLVFARGAKQTIVCAAKDVPITMGGIARYNIANALGVILLASAIGIPKSAIVAGLKAFRGTPEENPGRGHLYDFGGAKVLVDFAHNPHGMRALIETARAIPAKRRIVILGQAGDRDDESIRGLARETWPWRPDRVILKEMPIYLRGRQRGESTGLIRDEFLKLGASESVFSHEETEMGAVRSALGMCEPGDVVLLPTHAERQAVIALMERLESSRWTPGQPIA